MAVQLSRPEQIRTRFVAAPPASTDRLPSSAVLLGVATRGLLVGLGLGAVLVAGGTSATGVFVAGVLALGVSLVSWSE